MSRHLFGLFFFGIIPIGLMWIPAGARLIGHYHILPSAISLAKYSDITVGLWIWRLAEAEWRSWEQSKPIQNPSSKPVTIKLAYCWSGWKDSSSFHADTSTVNSSDGSFVAPLRVVCSEPLLSQYEFRVSRSLMYQYPSFCIIPFVCKSLSVLGSHNISH